MTIDEIAELHGLLADTTRLRILNLLRGGPLCVCHIVAALDLPQSTVSRHLSWLKVGRLVELNQAERYSIYSPIADGQFTKIVNAAAKQAGETNSGIEDMGRLRDALRKLPNKYVSRTE